MPLPVELVRRVYAAKGATWEHGAEAGFAKRLSVSWSETTQLYPELADEKHAALPDRLAAALRLVP